MLKLYFYFLQIVLKIPTFGKTDKDKSFGEQAKPTNCLICFCYLVSLSRFLTKTAKISHYSQSLHSLFIQLWDVIFYLSEVLVLANEITMWWPF